MDSDRSVELLPMLRFKTESETKALINTSPQSTRSEMNLQTSLRIGSTASLSESGSAKGTPIVPQPDSPHLWIVFPLEFVRVAHCSHGRECIDDRVRKEVSKSVRRSDKGGPSGHNVVNQQDVVRLRQTALNCHGIILLLRSWSVLWRAPSRLWKGLGADKAFHDLSPEAGRQEG